MRLLFVAMPEAIHTARWIGQLSETGWDLHLFPSRDVPPVDEMPDVALHTLFPAEWRSLRRGIKNVPLIKWPYARAKERILRCCAWRCPLLRSVSGQLAEVINRFQPDIVHTLEMQLAGYLMLDALPFVRERSSFKWVYSCWGNDITFYRNRSQHYQKIEQVLGNVDFYSADCHRDIQLIESFRPRGTSLGVFPTGGGYDLKTLRGLASNDRTSKRKVIALKGYHSLEWTGRAINSLRAMQLCKDALRDYEIVVYRPSAEVRHVAEYLAQFEGLNIRCLPAWIDNLDVVKLLGQSRIAISTNSGDGTPNAMLEAMIMGAFPIQSSTADTEGWIQDGVNGLIVPYDDVEKIAAALRLAVSNDELVDQAAEVSRTIVDRKLDRAEISQRVISAYETILA